HPRLCYIWQDLKGRRPCAAALRFCSRGAYGVPPPTSFNFIRAHHDAGAGGDVTFGLSDVHLTGDVRCRVLSGCTPTLPSTRTAIIQRHENTRAGSEVVKSLERAWSITLRVSRAFLQVLIIVAR